MIIGATGVVIDHYGDVLLIQRDDTRTLAPPGGAVEIGELPTAAAEREVKEETGLIVMPVRLVGLFFLPSTPENYLAFWYRCIMRGGQFKESEEALRAGFFKSSPLPKPMLSFHKKRLIKSLNHHQGPPHLEEQNYPLRYRLGRMFLNLIVYPWLHLRRKQKGHDPYQPPPRWRVVSYLIITNQQGKLLWTKSPDSEEWTLPAVENRSGEAPWTTAVKMYENFALQINRLVGVYPAQKAPLLALTFTASINTNTIITDSTREYLFFDRVVGPPKANIEHAVWARNVLSNKNEIDYGHCNVS